MICFAPCQHGIWVLEWFRVDSPPGEACFCLPRGARQEQNQIGGRSLEPGTIKVGWGGQTKTPKQRGRGRRKHSPKMGDRPPSPPPLIFSLISSCLWSDHSAPTLAFPAFCHFWGLWVVAPLFFFCWIATAVLVHHIISKAHAPHGQKHTFEYCYGIPLSIWPRWDVMILPGTWIAVVPFICWQAFSRMYSSLLALAAAPQQ